MLAVRKRSDALGMLIKLMIICIIWYSECIQQRFFQINNFLMLAGSALLLFVLLDISSRKVRLSKIIPAPIRYLISFIVYMLIVPSLFAASFTAHITQWTISFEFVLVMLCVVYICQTRNCVEFFIINYMFMYLAMCIIFLISPIAYLGLDVGRYTFGINTNPNGFSIGLTMGIFSTLYLVSRKKVPLILGLVLSMVYLFAIFQTGSRKGLIGCVFCLAMWLIMCYIPSVPHRQVIRKLWRSFLVIAFVVVALVIMRPYYYNSDLARRMTYAAEELTSGDRGDMYSLGFYLWRQHPIFGIGFQGFSHYYSAGAYSHATLIEVPVSGGAIGMLIYLSAYFALLKDIIRRIRQDLRAISEPDKIYFQHRMALILFGLLAINFVCIIHPYQLDSNVNFALAVALCYTVERDEGVEKRGC